MGLRCIISPAKKMVTDDCAPYPRSTACLMDRTRVLLEALRRLSRDEAQALWKCSDKLAALNYERLAHMDLDEASTSAVVAYEGIQYQHIAAQVMDEHELAWLGRHLRILSGFYGMLRPFDAVVAYRLEMQAKLAVGGSQDLYAFWSTALADALLAEGCDALVNLASVEYAKAVVPHARQAGIAVLTCLFGSLRKTDGRFVQRATEAKAARGTFVRWCAERDVRSFGDLRAFDERGYQLDEARSDADTLVFVSHR